MLNKTRLMCGLLAALCASTGALSAVGGAKHADLLKALSAAKITLQQGLTAAALQGQPISSEYEVEDGHLQLSVYVVKGGSYSEFIVDHMTGKVTKAEAITEGDDLAAAKSQAAAIAKSVTPLAAALEKAEQASAGYRAVSVVARRHQRHAVAIVELHNGKQFKTVSESLE
jgi:hypothetical protein